MASWFGDANDNTIDWSSHGLAFNETGHSLSGLGGNDTIIGGNKGLIGGAYIGSTLDGGAGDDLLIALVDDGRGDIINDDMSATWTPGSGGGANDFIDLVNTNLASLAVARSGDDLLLSNVADFVNDNQFNSYVTVEDFFTQGQGFIEVIGVTDALIAGTDLVAIVPNDGNFYLLV